MIPLFILIPLIELALLATSWHWIGFFSTLLIVILTGVIGGYIARQQALKIWNQLKNEVSQGVMPGNTLLEGAVTLIAGILLLTPGYLSDLTGFLLLIPFVRRKVRFMIYLWLKQQLSKGRLFFHYRR
nr:FxsA family protein [Pullulanibacillus pueri]